MRDDDEASDDAEENDEAWEAWEIESESSDDSSDSGRWIDVESDCEFHLNVSDSDDEERTSLDKLRRVDEPAGDANRTSTLNNKGVVHLSSTNGQSDASLLDSHSR